MKATHGKEWKRNAEVIRKIGLMLNIHPLRNEGFLDYADRIEKALN